MWCFDKILEQNSGHHEIADFMELRSWCFGHCSLNEVARYLGHSSDNLEDDGCENDDDKIDARLDEVMSEIESRKDACETGYPFEVEKRGTVLRYVGQDDSVQERLYLYLLLSTRLNMKDQRSHAGVDGTKILEHVSAEILRNYLGRQRAKSLVFGTAAGQSFPQKVAELCTRLGEGQYSDKHKIAKNKKDDGLDVVAWIPFADERKNKLILFGQCKTGTTWDLTKGTSPEAFVDSWIDNPPLVKPIATYIMSEALGEPEWSDNSRHNKLLFDRCRIVNFGDSLDPEQAENMKKWTDAAFLYVKSRMD